jgi:hypothetical protein
VQGNKKEIEKLIENFNKEKQIIESLAYQRARYDIKEKLKEILKPEYMIEYIINSI